MVTQIKQQKTTGKLTPPPLHKLDGKHPRGNGAARGGHAKRDHDESHLAEDATFTEQHDASTKTAAMGAGSAKPATLVERGKDLLSGEVGSVAAATAVVVGAALIEVELIPGLLIGAGAILLGRFFPELGSYVRPAIKGAVRAGFSMSQKAREVMAEASEQVHDLVAEVKHEQDQPLPEGKHAKSATH